MSKETRCVPCRRHSRMKDFPDQFGASRQINKTTETFGPQECIPAGFPYFAGREF